MTLITLPVACVKNWATRNGQGRCTRKQKKRLNQIQAIRDVFPSQANFILFHCTQASQVCKRLLEKGIVVRDRSNLMGLEDCIRVTVGTAAENDVFLNELQELL